MTWRVPGCEIELKDSVYLAKPGRKNGLLPVIDYYGKKEALIRAGIVTEEMLRLDPVDNGFGITEDEFGNHMCFIENFENRGIYLITRYLDPQDRAADEPDFRGRSIDQVDVGGILEGIAGGES